MTGANNRNMTMPRNAEELLAEAQIKDVHPRYCRANDRRDADLMRGCFHPDAVIELHEELNVDAFIEMGKMMFGQFEVTWHNSGNQLVEVDGDAAWAEHYTISSHRTAASGDNPASDFIVHGRYIDRMEKRDGEWRIARRKMVVDYSRNDVVADAGQGLGSPGGSRDRNDPSYTMRLRED